MKKILLILAFALAFLAGAATVAFSPLRAGGDSPLEPSIQNEVDHAISLAERALAKLPPAKPETREETALRLISTQRANGTWPGDAAVTTRRNLEILKLL